MNKNPRSILLGLVVNFIVPVALIAGTVLLVRPWMGKKKRSKTAAPTTKTEKLDLETVEVFTLQPTMAQPKLESTGVATPNRKMTVVPELSAKVKWVSSNLEVGGTVRAGEALVKLDNTDVRLRLRTQQNQIAKAKLDLELEKERVQVAKRELKLLEQSQDLPAGTNKALATRSHHLQAAKVAVDAAKSSIRQAEVQLERTVIRAPFDAVVLAENVEPGQVVGPASVIATLIGAHELHVRATVPVTSLTDFVLNGPKEKRTQAKVTLQAGARSGPSWKAYADRLIHELDAKSMNAQVLFVVEDPFATKAGQLPLLSNSRVNLEIYGTQAIEVFEIPRRALAQGSAIWVTNQDNTLHKVQLQVRWSNREFVYAQSPELKAGATALTRPPRAAIEGAKVKLLDKSAQPQEEAA